jgi:hypothetical protein
MWLGLPAKGEVRSLDKGLGLSVMSEVRSLDKGG